MTTQVNKTSILTLRRHFFFSQWFMLADLIVQVKQVGVVFPDIRLCVRDQLPDISERSEYRS